MQRKLKVVFVLMGLCLQAIGQGESIQYLERPYVFSQFSRPTSSDKLTAEDYRKLTTSGRVVLIDFYASWCGPCKMMEPMLRELSEEQKGRVEVVRINVDENKDLMRDMSIWEIPVVKIYKDGREEWSRVGYIEKRVITRQLRKL